MESQWLTLAKRLQGIASNGLHFSHDEYHRERFAEVGEIANAMLADLGQVPIERIQSLVSEYAKGYLTPKVDVRGALIEQDRILLVRERSDGLWTLPGGFADIGRSPAQNVAKEFLEEAGMPVEVRHLYSVRHKAKQAYEPDARDFYKLFFLCERVNDSPPVAGKEVSEARFFARGDLPPLSRGRVIEEDINAAFGFREGARVTVFD